MRRFSVHTLVLALSFGLLSACAEDPFNSSNRDMGPDTPNGDVERDGPRPQKAQVGEVCAGPGECVENALCVGNPDAAFTCMASCPTPYTLCDDGSVCLSSAIGDSAICYTGGDRVAGESCQTNLDCLNGNLCIGRAQQFLCHEACGSDADCEPYERCRVLESGSRICESRLGKSCVTVADCVDASHVCTSEVDAAFDAALPGGMCTFVECDESTCPDGSICLDLPGTPSPSCVPTCDDDSDCRFTSGYACRDQSACTGFDDEGACRQAIDDSTVCLTR